VIGNELLPEVLDDFLAHRCTPEISDQDSSGAGRRALWKEMEQLGFTTVSVPESSGGAGGSFADACTLVRAVGRYALPLPVAETSMLAGWLAHRGDMFVPPGGLVVATGSVDAPLAIELTRDGGIIRGQSLPVRWGSSAGSVVILARDQDGRVAITVVEAPCVQVVARPSLSGEPIASIVCDEIEVPRDSIGRARAWVDEDEVLARGALMRSIATVGALERIQQLTVEYARDRHQFGRPIASFQAVQGLLAELARDVAMARGAVDLAARQTEPHAPAPRFPIAAARVVSNHSARSVSRRAHQVHGAIGVTTEYPLHLLTTRVLAWREDFGGPRYWQERLGQQALESAEGLWPMVVATRPGGEPFAR
jgi:acyl-CoA dehydrogenase